MRMKIELRHLFRIKRFIAKNRATKYSPTVFNEISKAHVRKFGISIHAYKTFFVVTRYRYIILKRRHAKKKKA